MFKSHHFIPQAIAATVIATSSIAAFATEPFVIQDIRIEGLQRVEPGTVFSYLPIKKGETFSDDKASEAIKALFATGFFNDVKISTDSGIVIVQVLERPAITALDFSGLKEFDKDNLTKALRAIGLSQGRYFDKGLAEKAEQELKRQYLTRGYYAAEVTTTVTPIDKNRIALLFSVVEGPKAKIKQVNFIGNKAFKASTLQEEMQLSKPNWFSWYTKSDLYSKEKLTGDIEKIRSFYLNRGYLDFNIESTQVSISPDKKDMYLTLALHEGEPYTVSSIELTGQLLDKKDELQKLIKIKPNDRFSAAKLQESTKAIVDKLGEYGYAFATVNAQPDSNSLTHKVALTLQVQTEQRVYVRRVNILGNTKTRDEVIRREVRQFESAWFDSSRLQLSQDRINRLGYFTDVNIATTPVPNTTDQVDIDMKVTEKPTGAVSVGAGYSSADKVVLSGSISQENVFGSGTSLGLNVNTAKNFRTFSLTQTDPYFTIDGISRITSIYYRTFQPLYYSGSSNFKIVTAGGDLKFGVPFSETDTVYFGTGFQQNRMTVDNATPQLYRDYVNNFGRISNTVPLTVGWARDKRDSALIPSRGYYTSANAELGTPAGDTRYYRLDLQHQYYHSFSRGFVLGLNGEIGFGRGMSGKPYPIFKNYYGGGIGSVRGYSTNSLGPRDSITNDPVGGAKKVVANIELAFPLPGTGYDRTLRLFTFMDVGNIWGDNQPIKFNELRYGYGVGLAWISPIGPLKISLGFPLIKRTGDQYKKFDFQIGTSF